MNKELLDIWVRQYNDLDTTIKFLTKRRDELNKNIKKQLMLGLEPDDDGHIRYSQNGLTATLQVKRQSIQADEGALQQLLTEKNLWDEAKMEVANRDIVKQLWIEGKLTDDDLRSILPDPKDPTTALKVDRDV